MVETISKLLFPRVRSLALVTGQFSCSKALRTLGWFLCDCLPHVVRWLLQLRRSHCVSVQRKEEGCVLQSLFSHKGEKPCLKVSWESPHQLHWPKLGTRPLPSLQGWLGKGYLAFTVGGAQLPWGGGE